MNNYSINNEKNKILLCFYNQTVVLSYVHIYINIRVVSKIIFVETITRLHCKKLAEQRMIIRKINSTI